MVTVVLAVATLICAFGWCNQKAINYALLKWIFDHLDSMPGEELKDDLAWAWKNMLGIK